MASSLEAEYRGLRRALVETLQEKGITDLAVLRAVDEIPRHSFVPASMARNSYQDSALPIGGQQWISQPYVHARALENVRLTGCERVLEIGTGTGYQTALLSRLAAQVFSVERDADLLNRARKLLPLVNASNVSLSLGDGSLGWREYAPYDAIIVSAGAPDVPAGLQAQLAEGGRLLIPIGDREEQMLTVLTKRGENMERRDIERVHFVPLVGAGGWPS